MQNIFHVLEQRGFIQDATSEQISELLHHPITLYAGFDPTADSLHLGNLVGLIALGWFQRLGHKPIALVGGATGMVGDPSGKSIERNLLDEAALAHNLKGIRQSIQSVLGSEVEVLNNFDWMQKFSYIDFLRDIGKHFRMGTLLAKESVRTRLSSDEGLSYTEFSYQLLQAYDFVHLSEHHGVSLQIGGSDQWGNITAGTELVRRMRSKTVHGLTFPLLTRSDGKKFGKTEDGAIWLNEEKLSVYDFYQYLIRIPDEDVIPMMKKLTFMSMEEIHEIEVEMSQSTYRANSAQKVLARNITEIVHGKKGVEKAELITQAASPGAVTLLDAKTLENLALQIPSKKLPLNQLQTMTLLDLLIFSGFLSSKGEARRLVKNGGVYLNNEKMDDTDLQIDAINLVENRFLLLGIGKKKKMVIRVE